jgi:hypothetical protein
LQVPLFFADELGGFESQRVVDECFWGISEDVSGELVEDDEHCHGAFD